MLNFTVGPVQSSESVREIGKENVPYFRTPEFSAVMLENERLVLKFAKAPTGSRAVFLTASGTGSMEATVINVLNRRDKVLVINGGSFGTRFAELCRIHELNYEELKLEHGRALTKKRLYEYDGQGFTALLVNLDETSTGVLYDAQMLGEFCKKNGMLFIIDAISAFLCDPIDMDRCGADVLITGSQKALACPPGVSLIVLSPRALKRVGENDPKCMYLNLKSALSNMERGQTPFTPAVGTLLQIHRRLLDIDAAGGVDEEVERTARLAGYFRSKIADLPLDLVSESPTNAVTPVHPRNSSAYEIFNVLKDEYGIWVCPNAGDMRETIFRVGHIGCLTEKDYDVLLDALHDLAKRGILR